MKIFRTPLIIVLLVVVGRAFNADAQTETVLYSFVGYPTDGAGPYAGLVQGSDGNFYGTTAGGGTHNGGTVFRISPSGDETVLYSFGNLPDGDSPNAGLVQGSDGNLYGTTYQGGASNAGTVFRISPSGSYTNLYSLLGPPTDGYRPVAGLVQSSDGNFYGTTEYGGTNNCYPYGCGTVFRISPGGNETVLYSFGSSPVDGQVPIGGLVQGSDGNFYGTTEGGGSSSPYGTVFRISPSGSYTSLYYFGNYPDGAYPYAGLVQGSDGNFYGTTVYGGDTYGTVFRISPSGSETNLYSFGSQPNDGRMPESGLVQGSDGNFYGTTYGVGTVFRISPSGTYSNLYSFAGPPNDGENPLFAGLVQGSDGSFYGTTYQGGTSTNCGGNGCGTVFKLTVPLNPPPYPINQITGVQLSGTNVVLTIPSVAYETYQLQFSSSLTPTNWINEGGTITSIGGLLTLTNFGGASPPQGFYRFDIAP